MDGRLLARAREEKERLRRRSLKEDQRRHKLAYERVPELRDLDERIADIMTQTVSSVLGQGRPIEELRRESLDLQARRAELLVENGWPIDFLDGAWDCPKCKDTGYVLGEPCSCLLALYDKARTRDLSALIKLGSESFGTFDLGLYPDTREGMGMMSPRQQMETIYNLCWDYAMNFAKRRTNLLFQGGTGLGKTFLSACIAREVSKQGYSVVYETVVDALAAFESQKFSRDGQGTAKADDLVRRMTTCDLLIVDDLGTEMTNEFTKSALYTLINTRLLGKVKTVISTNLTTAQMAQRYTPAIMSRLEGEYQILPFAGTDIRKLRNERGDT